MSSWLEPTPAGSAVAAALIVAGAPLFGAALRSLRLRRQLRGLTERPLAEVPSGFVMVRGQVALDSPLVGPISGKPCAGFELEVIGAGTVARVEDRRPFRLIADDVTARVLGPEGQWDLRLTAERNCLAGEPLTQNVEAILERSSEAKWIRSAGTGFVLRERSLIVGHECFVVGRARQSRPFELPARVQWLRTGTDDLPVELETRRFSPEPDLWIEADGQLEFLRISDRAPDLRTLRPPLWRLAGVALGPLLSLTGMLYLANAAQGLRSAGRF